jgi:DNA-binding MarR family transcriptional regulator
MSYDHTSADLPDIGSDLRLVLGRLVRRVREETPHDGLTWPQMQVLGHIERDGPTTVTGLAKFAGVRSQTMGATVADLVATGHLSTESDPDDRRAVRASLTDRGREIVRVARTARADWLNQAIRERLTSREQAQLATAVSLLKRLVD